MMTKAIDKEVELRPMNHLHHCPT